MGSATVYHLASRGRRVLGLEQHNIPNDLGSSHGVNRIIRMAYAEDPSYIPLLRRAYTLWRDLEQKTGEQLLFITGGIDAGTEDSWIIRGSLESCQLHGLQHEKLTAAGVRRKFPGFRLPNTMMAVFQPESGFVLSERSIVAHVNGALNLGAEIHACETVLDWEVQSQKVIVHTDRGTYRAGKLVVTAGPWAGHIIKQLKPIVNPERQVLLWIQPKRPEYFKLGKFPVFYMQDRKKKYYGLPIFGVPGFKIGKYNHLREQVNPDRMDRKCHRKDEQVLRLAIRQYFPDADGPTMAMQTCLFSNTEDEHFILDHHPDFPQVSIAAGFSGHGFKFCPVIGEIMSDLALDDGSKFDLDLFKLKRLLPA